MIKTLSDVLLALAAVITFAACSPDSGDGMQLEYSSLAQSADYYGQWTINGESGTPSKVKVTDNAFIFSDMPFVGIAKCLFPDQPATIENPSGYIVPCADIAYTDRTIIYTLAPNNWAFEAAVGGAHKHVDVSFQSAYDGSNGSWGTLSRQSGVYTVVLWATAATVTDADTGQKTSHNISVKIQFTTTKRVK